MFLHMFKFLPKITVNSINKTQILFFLPAVRFPSPVTNKNPLCFLNLRLFLFKENNLKSSNFWEFIFQPNAVAVSIKNLRTSAVDVYS